MWFNFNKIPSESYLSPKGKDASNFIEDVLNDTSKILEGGFYHITRPLNIKEKRDNILPNVILYTTKNIEVLKIAMSQFNLSNLVINNSLVKDPTPDVNLITLQFKHINMQWSSLNNITLIGNEERLIYNGLNSGATGIKFDSTGDCGGTLKEGGECHRVTFNNVHLRFLNTGLLCSNLPEHNKRNAGNSEHIISNLSGIGVKKFVEFNNVGEGSIIKDLYYQNRQVLLREEKDFDLIKLNSDFMRLVRPTFYDPSVGKKFKNRLGVDIIGHEYLLTNYKEHNILDQSYQSFPIKEVKKFKYKNV